MTQPIGVLEINVLSILKDRRSYLRYRDLLSADFFKSRELRTIYKAICKLHEKFRKPKLTAKQIWLLLEKFIDEEDTHTYKKLLLKIKSVVIQDQEVVEFSITRFCQENLLKNSIQGVVNQLEVGSDLDLEGLKNQLDRIISLDGAKRNPDYEYISHHAERLDLSKEPDRMPTGISKELDLALGGGLSEGELGFVLAPPGRGKTLTLVNIGAHALKLGKKVLHLTFEIKARQVGKRYDVCIAERTLDELREDPTLLTKRLDTIKERGGELIIRDYSYSHCSIAELNSLMQGYQDNNTKFDIVIVDYADLMIPPQHYKDTRHEIGRIYEELRILAGHFRVPVWTASQANRASLGRRTIGMESIAEAFSKANVADLMLALCQTDEEKSDGEVRIFVAKSRMGSTNPIMLLLYDPDRMLLKPVRDHDKDDIWNRPRISKVRSNIAKIRGRQVNKGSRSS